MESGLTHDMQEERTRARIGRARAIASAGGLEPALASGVLPRRIDAILFEALVLGLLRQGVRAFLCVLGHGSTEVGEVLRAYEHAGVVRVCGVRSEIETSHAAVALRWVTGEKAAVVTSIGAGGAPSTGSFDCSGFGWIGVWYLAARLPARPLPGWMNARGCILLLDNRRMGAISGLQLAQYGVDHWCEETQSLRHEIGL